MPTIDIRHVTKVFGHGAGRVVALRDVSFPIDAGEFVCVIGPSGCGKSTLLLCLAGLERPSEGEILLDGRRIERPGSDRSVVFQEYALFPWRTVLRNVVYGLETRPLSRREREEIGRRFIAMVGLAGHEHRYPRQLSGGMKQRVAIARALAVDPKVLLMDEPFGALDALTREALQTETLRIWEATRKTVVFVTHSIDEALMLADRIVVLGKNPGHLRACLPVPLARPRSADTPHYAELREAVLQRITEPGPAPVGGRADGR